MFSAIKKKLKALRDVLEDPNRMMERIIAEDDIQNKIIELNQQQLYDKGIQADGTPTGNYSETSIEVFGKEPGHITLKDTGAFFSSFKVIQGTEGFLIIANTLKAVADYKDVGLTFDLLERWPKALGLTQESKNLLSPDIADKVRERLKLAISK